MAHNWRYKEGGVDPNNGDLISFSNNYRWISPEFGDDGNTGEEDSPLATPVVDKINICNGYFYNVAIQADYIADGFCFFNWNNPFIASILKTGGSAYGIILGEGLVTDSRSSLKYSIQNSSRAQTGISNPTGRYYSIFIYPNPVTIQYNHGGISEFIPSNYTHIFNAAIVYDDWRGRIASNMVYATNGAGTVNIQDENIALNTRYSVYVNNLPIKLTGGGLGADETTFTTASTIEDLRNRAAAVYGGSAVDYFISCRVLPPTIFNEDYSLNTTPEGLIAATMADNYGFVGAKDMAIQVSAGASFLSTSGMTLDSGAYKLSGAAVGTATTAWQDNGKVRELGAIGFVGDEAPLNGEQVDSSRSWGDAISVDTNNDFTGLIVDKYYTVDTGGGVTYNGNTILVGSTFLVVAGVTTATDNDGLGTIRLQLESPNRKTIELRTSEGGFLTTNLAGSAAVDDDWFKVLTGSVSDGTNTFTVNQFLKYDSALTYTGTYQLQFVANDAAPYLLQEVSNANPVGIDSAGRGTGDVNFDYSTETRIRAKYWQARPSIQNDNNKFHTT